ncbi:MAG: hypothetical protein ACI9OJ_001088 [Myxococcota bacterium]
MSENNEPETAAPAGIEEGAYEVIKARLLSHGQRLSERARKLNEVRIGLFGGTQMEVVGNERVRTENNCVPRDIIAVHELMLFGYNVFIGLRSETAVEDVFSLVHVEMDGDSYSFQTVPVGRNFLKDEKFVSDFRELYRYYKDAHLLKLRRIESNLLAIFQVGHNLSDIKAFRWNIKVDGSVVYVDNRGEREHVYPPAFDFEWTTTKRDDHVQGVHPHISIRDEVFVETVGGNLTIKVENNTQSGQGIYAEPVDDANQSLDDAQVSFAEVGSLILIKILPYREEQWRHLVFNRLTKTVQRIDKIAQACIQLPEDHGIIFPGGYYLQRGETKTFDVEVEGMLFSKAVRSPNGEDVLYVFHRPNDGLYVLLPYNLIRKEVDTPIYCHGYSLFGDGKMVVFRETGDEQTRVHPMQVWQTAFFSAEFAAKRPEGDSFFENVGNADLVRGISDALSIARLTEHQSPTMAMYESLIAASRRVTDAYFWLGAEEVGNLREVLAEVQDTSELIVDEFVKVQALQAQAKTSLAALEAELGELYTTLRPDFYRQVNEFVDALSELRRARGRLITLRELRYMDLARVKILEDDVVARSEQVGAKAVEFLHGDDALGPYHGQIAALDEKVGAVEKVKDAVPLLESAAAIGDGLDLLTGVVGTLDIDDATVRTRILEGISEVMAGLNRSRAQLEVRRRALLDREGVAEFGAQFMLFGQSVTSALSMSPTPEKCDEQLSRLMLQLEELEGRFTEFDQFLEQLATKREEVYEAFGSKKQQLLDARQRRAQSAVQAAERVLSGIGRRAKTFSEVDDLNAYFASDAMVMKVRELAGRLRELEADVKADEVESRLKTAREDAVRSLRDRKEIYEDGASIIRLGKHRFSVNTQELELTMLPRAGGMALHLTGTDYYEALSDPAFEETRPYWDQLLVSETPGVYRGEYLAASILSDAQRAPVGSDLSLTSLLQASLVEGDLLAVVRGISAARYDEGYDRGVHDVDATRILARVLTLQASAGLLRFSADARSAAVLFWAFWTDDDRRKRFASQARSLARLRAAFGQSEAISSLETQLGEAIGVFYESAGLNLSTTAQVMAGRYLFEELARAEQPRFVLGEAGASLVEQLTAHLRKVGSYHQLESELAGSPETLADRYRLAEAWLVGFARSIDPDAGTEVAEATVALLAGDSVGRETSRAQTSATVDGLLGQHRGLKAGVLTIHLDEFLSRLTEFRLQRVPGYRAYQKTRTAVLERERERLRLGEYMPRVMSSFVRNQLINQVYLPVIGDNLAKQIGAAGSTKRTDLMGLLLLISPPGYGKTTLMEYVANRLGLVFMKINGPSLGHGVTSIDPAEAPNATARQEVEKINLGLEMGNNVLLYLDDIQHTHPELLQKFISLCDAQRKIEGVWRGRTRTYDLRGKRFIVCMAGNPYTESGDKFQIPDMLANRADVYNLGDILGGQEHTFALSYIENSMTSNTVMAQVSTHEHTDIYKLVRMALGEEIPTTELKHGYSRVEVEEILNVLKKLLRCQDVLLKVNQTYIASAGTDDAFRTEPSFKLQGSYRNMNKLAEKVVAVMNDDELEQLIDDHYLGEAQTLTDGAEWNLLKLAELRERVSPEQSARLTEIREGFHRQKVMGGGDDDPVTRVTGQLMQLSERLEQIGTTISSAAIAATSASDRQFAADQASPVGQQIGMSLAPLLKTLDASIAALAETELNIEVHNEPPGHYSEMVLKQIEVVEASLVPMIRSLSHSMSSDNAVWERLGEVLEGLKRLSKTQTSAAQRTSVKAFPGEPSPAVRVTEAPKARPRIDAPQPKQRARIRRPTEKSEPPKSG